MNNGCDSYSDDDDPFDCYNNRLALDKINESAAAGATVYTIGLGADSYLDEAFLKKAANLTGGSYYQAQNSDELDEVFSDIRNEFSNETFVARTPLTTNMSASGQVYAPQIAGDTDGVSNVTIGGQTYLNVNDPDAPSRFSHSFAIQDGGSITFNVTQYSCDEWQATPRTHTNNSTSFQVVRCAEINESDSTTIRPRLDNDNDDAYDEDPAYGASSGVNDDSDGEIDEDPIDGLMLDGDDASALIANDPAWWQTDINESLTAFPDVTINKTTGELHMNSNQALVIFDLPDGEETSNMLVLLYQVGLSESNARPEGVINIQISEVSID